MVRLFAISVVTVDNITVAHEVTMMSLTRSARESVRRYSANKSAWPPGGQEGAAIRLDWTITKWNRIEPFIVAPSRGWRTTRPNLSSINHCHRAVNERAAIEVASVAGQH